MSEPPAPGTGPVPALSEPGQARGRPDDAHWFTPITYTGGGRLITPDWCAHGAERGETCGQQVAAPTHHRFGPDWRVAAIATALDVPPELLDMDPDVNNGRYWAERVAEATRRMVAAAVGLPPELLRDKSATRSGRVWSTPDDDPWHQVHVEAGYAWCRAHGEYHRPPECPVDEQGRPAPWWEDDEEGNEAHGDRARYPDV